MPKKEDESKEIIIPENFILVEGGSYEMGDNTWEWTKPIHKVSVSSFYISKYQTTQKEYKSIMLNNPSYFKGDNLPVESVSWFDSIKYCNEKSKKNGLSIAYNEITGELLDSSGNVTTDITKVEGYRLLTEAEWEFSARGGNKSQGYTYSGSNDLNEVAWYEKHSGFLGLFLKTHKVGEKKSNELGLYDMSGNVWEWCTDWYDFNYYNNSIDINPINSKNSYNRVNRGGSWFNIDEYLRIGDRAYNKPNDSFYNIGFRIARTY